MNEIKTGGPAFPHTIEYRGIDCGGVVPHGGMTLRDYFAAKAMQALIERDKFFVGMGERHWTDQAAESAYMQADAMLKAREA